MQILMRIRVENICMNDIMDVMGRHIVINFVKK